MHRLVVSLVMGLASVTLYAQREVYMTWDEFVERYAAEGLQNGEIRLYTTNAEADNDDIASSALPEEDMTELERLEDLHLSPLDLNVITRDELLTLPFVSEAQADSLVAYRNRHGSIKSLGELQLIHGWDYETRRIVSLFVECQTEIRGLGKGHKEQPKDKWRNGVWQADTRLDVPLYTREGYDSKPQTTSSTPSNKYYTGSPLTNIVRLRYDYQRRLRYGVTLHKDAGEPFVDRRWGVYDSQSVFFSYKSQDLAWQVLSGDFRVNIGQGLVAGNSYLLSRQSLVSGGSSSAGLWRNRTLLAPQTSKTAEKTLRGAAIQHDLWHDDINIHHFSLMAFGSYRCLDARIEDDSVRAIHTSGYHRTPKEQSEHNNLWVMTGGARVQYEARGKWMVGVSGVYMYYDRPIAPSPRIYNTYYLHGTTAAAMSADYYFRLKPFASRLLGLTTLRGQGEVALDRQGYPAMTHTLQLAANRQTITLQGRLIDGKYVTPMGQTLIAGSVLQNEYAVLFGLDTRMWRGSALVSYFEYAFHPNPTYYAMLASSSYELGARLEQTMDKDWLLRLAYRTKVQTQNIPAAIRPQYAPTVQEFCELHRLTLSARHSQSLGKHRSLQIHGELSSTLYRRQTAATAKWGWMAFLRAQYRASSRLSVSAAAGYFDTDDYNTRIYATVPMLTGTAGFNSFAYRGLTAVGVCEAIVASWLRVGAKINMVHYLNRDVIASGLQQITGSNKSDVSISVRFRI